jgi:hypothetical protein
MAPIDRRSLLERALLIAGASVAPGFSLEALAQAPQAGEQLLSQGQFNLLSAVADTMVPRTDTPGAIDAGVPRSFDMLLRNWASPQRRQELVGALEAIDKLALARHKRPFADLTAAQRLALLTAHDAAALPLARGARVNQVEPVRPAPTVGDPDYGKPRQEPTRSSTAAGPAAAYAKLKELIVTLYYVSEPALTHELRYEHSPGEWIRSVPITPESRASGGLGAV